MKKIYIWILLLILVIIFALVYRANTANNPSYYSQKANHLIDDSQAVKSKKDIEPKKQNLTQVSYCEKIKKANGLVDFSNANLLYNKYRAFKSWPDIYLESGLKLKECQLIETESVNNAGEVLEINKEHIILGCEKGSIKINFVQPPSKKQMIVTDYIRGQRLRVGDTIS